MCEVENFQSFRCAKTSTSFTKNIYVFFRLNIFNFVRRLGFVSRSWQNLTVTAATPLTLTSSFYYDLTLQLVTKRVIKSVEVLLQPKHFLDKKWTNLNVFFVIRKVIFLAIFISHIVDFNFSYLTLCLKCQIYYILSFNLSNLKKIN